MTEKKTKPIDIDAIIGDEKHLQEEISKANAKVNSEYDNVEVLKQGSKAWFKARMGKFTGSKIPDLMKTGRSKSQIFGDTAIKVIKQVKIERDLTDDGIELYVDNLFSKNFKQTEWGNKYESFAIKEYEQVTGLTVESCYFRTHETLTNIGGSFDGKVFELPRIIEVKCPYDILVHDENVDLKKAEHEFGIPKKHTYYGQIQCNMFVAGVKECDFISFDPRRKTDRLAIITVKLDEEFIKELLWRVQVAELAIQYSEHIDWEGAILVAMKKVNEDAEAN